MAHMLENLGGAAGDASFVSARQHAWHRLGTVLPKAFDAAQAMQYAKLGGWDVRTVPLQTASSIDADGVTAGIDVPDAFATVRTNPATGKVEPLGVVGSGYRPVQNEAHAEVLNAVVDEGGAHFETAGSLRGGRQVFMTMKLPTTMRIGGVDPVDLYLVALNSHDGSSAFRLLVSPVRVVCANTQAAALRSAKSSFSIRHTAGATGRIAEARQALGLTFAYAEAFQAEADRLIEQPLSDVQFKQVIAQVWPTEATSSRTHAADERLRELSRLRRYSPTLSEDFRGSRWGAYQAITEYVDFTAPMRSRRAGQAERAERAVTGTGPAVKTRAFELIAAL
ncbi:DUF932 domain-containing protein [Nakamurella endophytica]|uniref:DUF945 domain-containing protein n=1 Tax=Nakamurella endophytica TaxID=1748367 RepID=A0A917WMT9_9ACTN|nr:DUF932 domain-containing protein [Nakamurella endophytica]GGM15800.1 hypothetical protein GCM10011594_39800 [Nakamurella endophytica]